MKYPNVPPLSRPWFARTRPILLAGIIRQLYAMEEQKLPNLLRRGNVFVNIDAVIAGTCTAKDILIFFGELDSPNPPPHLATGKMVWILSFINVVADIEPVDDPALEDLPEQNPGWSKVVCLPRVELLEKITAYVISMDPLDTMRDLVRLRMEEVG